MLFKPVPAGNRREEVSPHAELEFAGTRHPRADAATFPPALPQLDLLSLVTIFDGGQAVTANLAGLSDHQVRVLDVAHFFGGSTTRAQLDAEPHGLAAAAMDELLDSLVVRLLVQRVGDGIELLGGIAERLQLPLPSLASSARLDLLTHEQLAGILRSAERPVPAKKVERSQAVVQLCNDVSALRKVVSALRPASRALFMRFVDHGGPVHLSEYGIDLWSRSYSRMTSGGAYETYMDLRNSGLVIDDQGGRAAIWMELFHVATNSVFARWPVAVELSPQPIREVIMSQPTAATAIDALLRVIQAEPIPALKTGGIGISTIRGLAKRLSIPVGRVTLLLGLLRSAHVVVPKSELVGTGRRAEYVVHFHVDQKQAAVMLSLDSVSVWGKIVEAWLDGAELVGAVWHAEYEVKIGRREIIADLLSLPVGSGVDPDRFARWAAFRHQVCFSNRFDDIVDELRSLELVPSQGPAGLTSLARSLLTDPAAAAAALPAPVSTFVVQPDHTVIADGSLDVAIRAELERMATLVSSGGALVYRLDVKRIANELSTGTTGSSLVGFLTEHASVPVPQAVHTLIADAERQRGGLTVTAAATVLTADDPVALARAVAVKAAKLRFVTPTVAVSDLKPAAVANALRAKQLAPSMGEAGPPSGARTNTAGPKRTVQPSPTARTVVHPDAEAIRRKLQGARG